MSRDINSVVPFALILCQVIWENPIFISQGINSRVRLIHTLISVLFAVLIGGSDRSLDFSIYPC